MAVAKYIVSLHEQQWWIIHDAKRQGPYDMQRDAIKDAAQTAQEAGKLGHNVQVLVQGEDGKFVTEWTYDEDPFPPRG
ncbi:MAG: DUF2188 domain-containing protein [Rhodospirillales bacterium]|nr:DUF2188 domain-containing protein [Rhodospirillales bacterium]